jgi:glycosyltransferase involved in cell wall biosynthesis
MCHLVGKEIEAQVCTVTDRHDNGLLVAELSKAGISRHDLCARRLADPIALIRLIRLIQRERIDIVHAHGQDASILAAIAKHFSKVPLVITRHVLDEPSKNWRQSLRARFALAAIRSADAVVAVSSAVADRLADIAHLPRSDIRVIQNGVEIDKFNRPELIVRRDEFRKELGFEPDHYLVLVPSVLREGKGHEVLFEAIPSIRERLPNTYVLLAGVGECEAELRIQARLLGDAVVFLGQREDIPELLSACDLVVLPSLAEALPTALIEAAAAGRPIVATRVGGTEEIIEHGSTGFLLPPNDSILLAEYIIKILSDPALARKFGEEASSLSHKRFSIDLQIKQTLELWKEVKGGANQ